MLALRLHGRNDIRLDQIDEPSIRPGWVKIEIHWCGVCGTDVQQYEAGPFLASDAPHPITGECLPLTMGHEMSGVLVEIGADVHGLTEGVPVVVEPVFGCMACTACRRRRPDLCGSMGSIGLTGWGGGFASHIVVPARLVHPLADTVDMDVAALIEPVAVGWHGVLRSGLRVGDRALVVGAGPIGQGVARSAAAVGASWIGVVEPSALRREALADLGVDLYDPRDVDVRAAVLEASEGEGVDVAFDTSADSAGIQGAIASVRRGGTLVNLAGSHAPEPIDLLDMLVRSVSVVSSLAYGDQFPVVIDQFASGAIRPGTMITRRTALTNAVESAFDELADPTGRDRQVKVLVTPSQEVAGTDDRSAAAADRAR